MIQPAPFQGDDGANAIRVRLLGPFTIESSHTVVKLPSSVSARALLAYLLLDPQKKYIRPYILEIFWPDLSESRGRQALSQALWSIRQCLPAILAVDGDIIAISSDVSLWIDVHVFEASIGQFVNAAQEDLFPELYEAVSLYRGDLLIDIHDNWVHYERERLRDKLHVGLSQLLRAEKTIGRYHKALDLAHRLVELDPLDEQSHRELMQLYYLLQRPKAALQQFVKCSQVLHSELGLEPDDETAVLASEIAQSTLQEPTSYLPRRTIHAMPPALFRIDDIHDLPLVGREAERHQILQNVEHSFAKKGSVVLIEGELGIGKSRLLQEIVNDIGWRGAEVLRGAGSKQSINVTGNLLIELLSSGLTPLRSLQIRQVLDPGCIRVLTTLFPMLDTTDQSSVECDSTEDVATLPSLHSALVSLLAAWNRFIPLVLILDDIHSEDCSLWEVLAYFAQNCLHNTLIIGTFQYDVRYSQLYGRQMQVLKQSSGCIYMTLQPLSRGAMSELIQYALGISSDRLVAYLYPVAGGNPFFVLELLRSLYDEGHLDQTVQGHWDISHNAYSSCDVVTLPATIEQVVLQRVALIAPPAYRVLGIAAVLQDFCDFELLQKVSGHDGQRLAALLSELISQKLLIETAQGYIFSSQAIQHAVYASLASDKRVLFHYRVGEALSVISPAQFITLAYHCTEGQAWEQAIHYCLQAGNQLQSPGLFHTLARCAEKIIIQIDARDIDISVENFFHLLALYEAVLDALGRREDQVAALQSMDRLGQSNTLCQIDVLRRRSQLLAWSGDFDAAESMGQAAITLARYIGKNVILVETLVTQGRVLYRRNAIVQALGYLQEAIDLCAADNMLSDMQQAEVHMLYAMGVARRSCVTSARNYLTSALHHYVTRPHHPGVVETQLGFADIACAEGLATSALTYAQQALEMARSEHYITLEAQALLTISRIYQYTEQVQKALDYGMQALKLAQTTKNDVLEAWVYLQLAEVIHCFLHDHEAAIHYCTNALAYAQRAGDGFIEGRCFTILGSIARECDDYALAHNYYQSALTIMETITGPQGIIGTHVCLARLALDEHDVRTALHHSEQAIYLCQSETALFGHIPVAIVQSEVLLVQGEVDHALICLENVLARFPQNEQRSYVLLFAYYQALVAAGRVAEALSIITQTYHQLTASFADVSPAQQQSLEKVPTYSAIITAWQACHPRRVTWKLPRTEAPIGRPLREDEWVEVLWTLDAPEDKGITHKATRRRHRLLRLIQEAAVQGATPTIAQLAEALQYGERTIAQDLAALRQEQPDLLPPRGSLPKSQSSDGSLLAFVLGQMTGNLNHNS